jgi:hypothetical protein
MSNDTKMTPVQFVEMTNLQMTYDRVKNRPDSDAFGEDEWNKTAFHYLITLKTARRSTSLYYSKGSAHVTYQPTRPVGKPTWHGLPIKAGDRQPFGVFRREITLWEQENIAPYWVPTPPDMLEVLEAVALDCSTVQNNPLWEDYAAEMGCDVDSRKAHKAFKVCKRQADKVRSILGDVWYNALLYRVDFYSDSAPADTGEAQ